jgi:Conjugative transposon protein TcpC
VAHTGRVGGAVTSASLLKGLGRVVLWCALVVVLLRGVADLFGAEAAAPPARGAVAAPAAWPDDEARAFAVDFARAYLGGSPLADYVTPELAASIAPELSDDAEPPDVPTATVAGIAAIDDRHALVTVAAGDGRYLAVPVGRDPQGALAVYDLPSFEAPPGRASLPATQGEPPTGVERSQIEDVVDRFLRAFLAGRADELDYLAPTGARLGALGAPLEAVGMASLVQVGPGTADAREVLATIRARDAEAGVVYALRYRLQLVREDRWYVAAVNNATYNGG